MDAGRLIGPGAGARKYDVLTAIGAAGLHEPRRTTTMLRLIVLLTARYDWRRDEVACGQREMARMWGVSERTVKREVRRLCDLGLLRCLRPGVRGRVAAYRLDQAGLAGLSRDAWAAVGPDYAARMAAGQGRVVRVDFAPRPTAAAGSDGDGGWPAVRARLRAEAPDLWEAWFAHLDWRGMADGTARFTCARPFVARYVETHLARPLASALAAEFGPVARIAITAG